MPRQITAWNASLRTFTSLSLRRRPARLLCERRIRGLTRNNVGTEEEAFGVLVQEGGS